MITLDKKGYPVLKLGVAVPTESGNPFHDTFSGKFSFAPPGVKIVVGTQIVKNLSPANRRILFDAAKKTKANQMGVSLVKGKLQFTLFRNGVLLTRFTLADDTAEVGGRQGGEDSSPLGGLTAPTGAWRDAVVDAARETSLEGDALKNFFEEKLNMKLDERTVTRLAELVDEQRINDISDYLNSYLSDDSSTNKIRISAPRGFVRKAFASLEVHVIQEIFARLRQRGWSDEILNDKVAVQFSKEKRNKITGRNVAGRTNGKSEVS